MALVIWNIGWWMCGEITSYLCYLKYGHDVSTKTASVWFLIWVAVNIKIWNK